MERETSKKLMQGIENIQNIKLKRQEDKLKKEYGVLINKFLEKRGFTENRGSP